MKQLYELRLKKNLTQDQAASILGCSLRTYNAWENEAYEMPPLKLMAAISMLKKAKKRR